MDNVKALAVLAVALATMCTASWAQTPAAPAKSVPMKRDVFLTLAKSSLNNACEDPKSPYACMVKTVEICRKNLPVAMDKCEVKVKPDLPAEILPDETRKWSTHVARCVVDEYILLAGSANIDITKCPPRSPPK